MYVYVCAVRLQFGPDCGPISGAVLVLPTFLWTMIVIVSSYTQVRPFWMDGMDSASLGHYRTALFVINSMFDTKSLKWFARDCVKCTKKYIHIYFKNGFSTASSLEWNMSLCKCNIFHKAHFNILFYWLSVYQAPVWNIFPSEAQERHNISAMVTFTLGVSTFCKKKKKIWNVWFTSYAWKSKNRITKKIDFPPT